jgi:hypothetical protein
LIEGTKPSGKVVYSVVQGSKTERYPDGNDKMAWAALERHYRPETAPSRSKLHKHLFS